MIVVSGVTKRYGRTAVVDDVSLQLPRGGLTAIVGANGAGKSTLLSMIARLLGTDEGAITVGDLDIATSDSRELAKRLAILRQTNDLQSRLTVADLVGFGRFPHSGGRLTATDRAADELNKTVVIVVHDINYASCWADQIVAMKQGVIRAVGSPREIMQRPLLREVFDLDIEVVELRGHPIAHFYLPIPICANCSSANESCCLQRTTVPLGMPRLSA